LSIYEDHNGQFWRSATEEDIGMEFRAESMGKKFVGTIERFETEKNIGSDIERTIMIDTAKRQWSLNLVFVKCEKEKELPTSKELTFILNLELLDDKSVTFFNEDHMDFPSINMVKETWVQLGRPTKVSVKIDEYSPSFLTA